MPSIILVGAFNSNTPQENAGTFVGEYNVGGWDANMKMCQGHGGTFGWFNVFPMQLNLNFDNLEGIDGMMNDMDFKPQLSTNV